MTKLTPVLSAIFFCLVIHGPSGACVLTFDDITAGSTASINTYGGLTWTNVSVIHKDTDIFGNIYPGYSNGAVSGAYVAISDYDQIPAVSYECGQFDFNGVYLTAASNNGLSITAVGELNGDEIYSKTVTVDTTSPTWIDFSFFGIDELMFLSSGGISTIPDHPGGIQFAMDNFTFNEMTSVPVPGTIWLLFSGLLGLARYRIYFPT